MTDAAWRLSATPPFAGARVCAAEGCDTILASDNHNAYCSPCQRRLTCEPEAEIRSDGVDLPKMVAALLLMHEACSPGQPVNLRLELEALGVEADTWQIEYAVRYWRRRYVRIEARGRRGQPGYRVSMDSHFAKVRRRRQNVPAMDIAEVLAPFGAVRRELPAPPNGETTAQLTLGSAVEAV